MFKRISIFLMVGVMVTGMAFGHPGRTDSSGGHKDSKNVSGLGYYHYHCGGYPAHLHNNGVCPYKSGGAGKSTAQKKPAAPKVYERKYTLAGEQALINSSINDGTSYVAAADFAKFVGAELSFNQTDKTVTLAKGVKTTTLKSVIQSDRAFVALRPAIENLGHTLDLVNDSVVIS